MQRMWSTYLDPGVHVSIDSTASQASEPQMVGVNYYQRLYYANKLIRFLSNLFCPYSPLIFSPSLSLQMDSSQSRRSSIANSTFSQAASTHPMLTDSKIPLDPPNVPFSGSAAPSRSTSPFLMKRGDTESSSVSLTINYLPSKFSHTLLSPGGPRRRKKGADGLVVPKFGGGVEAFRSGEARMPGQGDEDYDGVTGGWFGGGAGPKRKLRWNRFKWILFVANSLLSAYSLVSLIFCLLTWFNVWTHADVIRVGNRSELILSTLAASVGIFTSTIGWAGILLNNRCFLAIYTFLLWITFALLVVPGYMTYKRRTFNLEGKVNAQWSRELGGYGRLRVQNQLRCCGYFNPFIEATVSQTCYARTILPGCKAPYIAFQKKVLERWYTVSFSLVPLHIAIILAGLLCSNHVTYRFGKGMMPKAYRLSMNSMAVIIDNYANQLAEQYGSDVASEIMARSRSNVQLDLMPTLPYNAGTVSSYSNKYESIGSRAPETLS